MGSIVFVIVLTVLISVRCRLLGRSPVWVFVDEKVMMNSHGPG